MVLASASGPSIAGDRAEISSPCRGGRDDGKECFSCGTLSLHETDKTAITDFDVRCGVVRLHDVSGGGRSAFEFHRHVVDRLGSTWHAEWFYIRRTRSGQRRHFRG